jgi:hypothetical protein
MHFDLREAEQYDESHPITGGARPAFIWMLLAVLVLVAILALPLVMQS